MKDAKFKIGDTVTVYKIDELSDFEVGDSFVVQHVSKLTCRMDDNGKPKLETTYCYWDFDVNSGFNPTDARVGVLEGCLIPPTKLEKALK